METRTKLPDNAWAMSILSKGSRCGPGKAPARTACSTVMGSSSKFCPAIAPGMSRANASASGSLPSRCLVAISQADAALTITSLSSSAIACRAGSDRRLLPESHQKNAWVSSSRRNAQLPSQAANSSSGSGSKKRSSSFIRPFMEPNSRLPCFWTLTIWATGVPLRAMTTSSPASTLASKRDRLVFASWTLKEHSGDSIPG